MTAHVQKLRDNALTRCWRVAKAWGRELTADERGDVPGWVLVTLVNRF